MASFEELLAAKKALVLPGAYDALSARIAVRAGAKAVYMTGFGVVGSAFGAPDIGLVGPDQMAERARALAAAIAPIPLVADGDNGHGGPANVARLVRAYECAGVACIQLEDQVSPKRCGHMDGKEIVPRAEAVAKIRAAAKTRSTSSFKIMARTDARATDGIDEALARGQAFLDAGADILFIEAPQTEEELRAIAERFRGVPLVANLVEDGKTPMLSHAALAEMGYKILLRPVSALLAAAHALEAAYAKLLAGEAVSPRASFQHYNDIVGLAEWQRFVEGCRQ
ncbi:MAG TPA: isocitrate lyase/PEP mutase family protein [Rhizomicrobium sp.]|nr:isocitrate lyase/PEP mutase family protein [Rhizomicrobium sp.]